MNFGNYDKFNTELDEYYRGFNDLGKSLRGIQDQKKLKYLPTRIKNNVNRISNLISEIDNKLKAQESGSDREYYVHLKTQLSSDLIFLKAKEAIGSAYTKLYNNTNLAPLLSMMSKIQKGGGYSSHSISEIRKLQNELDKLDTAPFSKAELSVIENLKGDVKQLLYDISLESAMSLADPILRTQSPVSLRSAFEAGNYPPIENVVKASHFEKTGSVMRPITQTSPYGSQTANKLVEKAVPFLLGPKFDQTKVDVAEKGSPPAKYLIFTHPELGNLEMLYEDWQCADKSTLVLSSDQLANYEKFLSSSSSVKPLQWNFSKDEHDLHRVEDGKKLSLAEKLSINIYSQDSGCDLVNMCLRGQTNNLTGNKLKESLMHTLVLHHALKKLPDFQFTKGNYAYRGQRSGEQYLKILMDKIDKGDALVFNQAFTSMSYGTLEDLDLNSDTPMGPVPDFFPPTAKWGILYTNPIGVKDITCWSLYKKSERELLRAPGNEILTGYYHVHKKDEDLTIITCQMADATPRPPP